MGHPGGPDRAVCSWLAPPSASADLDRVAGTGREVAGQDGLAGHRLGLGPERVLALQAVGVQLGHPQRHDAEHQGGHHPDDPGPAGHADPDPRPHAVLGRLGLTRASGRRRGEHPSKITSSAGNRVIMAHNLTATPMAITGPRLLVEASFGDQQGQQAPATTVAALAMIAGAARPSAMAMASWRSAWRRSSR